MDPRQTHASMQPRRGQYYNAAPVSYADEVRRQTRAFMQTWQTNRAYTQPQQNHTHVWVPSVHLAYTFLNQAPVEAGSDDMTQYEGILTAKYMLESLPNPIVLPLHVGPTDCVICQDGMCEEDEDNTITNLPCGHLFHRDCIVPWLCNHNTCPSCRFKLPADAMALKHKR